MNSINTIEGLLFRSYLTHYNLSLLHKCIKAGNDDYKNGQFIKAASFSSGLDFNTRIDRAKRQTDYCLNYCARNNIRIIPYTDKDYPAALLKIKDFPPLLFVKGDLKGLNKCAAVVGTRHPSILSKDKVAQVVKTFACHGYSIISGLAQGIDAMAHMAALNNRLFTAAILPSFFDKIIPSENIDLAKCILDSSGLLLTEQGPNYFNVANPFVLRNRIIAALSDFVIPIEMSIDSGTRHAVNYCVKYGKKLILCKPIYEELYHHHLYYEGIIAAIKKYRGKENVFVISDLKQLSSYIDNNKNNKAAELF